MRVLLELGRLLLADAARAAGRAAYRAADKLEAAEEPDELVPASSGELVPEEAAAMVAPRSQERVATDLPPPAGSLAARGREVGRRWAL
jgi:hypothetical protein